MEAISAKNVDLHGSRNRKIEIEICNLSKDYFLMQESLKNESL